MPQAYIRTPIGPLLIAAADGQLSSIRVGVAPDEETEADADAVIREALAQLRAWFDRRLTRFDLPLTPAPTPRGAAHREAIAAIAHGATASYGAIARTIGSSPRAVGQACRRNPFPIVIPCHRVIGAAGAIGHYSAGEGIVTKKWLLDHEAVRGCDYGK